MKDGWKEKRLEELFDIKSSKRVHKADWKTEGVPFYRAREVVKLAKNGFIENELFISEKLFEEFTKDKGAPKTDDLIISAVGTLGRCYLVKKNDRFYIKDASVLWFSKISDVNSRFIELAFQSEQIQKQVFNKSMGATVGTLTITRAKNIKIPIPPLSEQERIVSILEKAFDAIEKAKANAEENLKNSKELFESYLNNIFVNKGDDWEERKMGDVYDVRDGTHDSPKYQKEGFPLITSKNLKNYELNYNNVRYITEKDYKDINKRSKVDKGDILFAMIGTIGNPVVIEEEPNFAIKNVALFKMGRNQNPYFLKYFLDSEPTKNKMRRESKGTTQQFVGLGYLRDFPILIPSLEEQITIVDQLDLLRAKTQKLEEVYRKKITDLEEMKKSFLQKAFNGEL